MPEIEVPITRLQVEAMLQCSQRQVSTYQKKAVNPLPIAEKAERGKANTYCARQIMLWKVEEETRKITGNEEDGLYEKEAEQARLYHHQANKAAFEESKLQGDLVESDLVAEHWAGIFSSIKAKLITVCSTAAPKLTTKKKRAEINEILKEDIFKMLDQFANEDGLPDVD